MTVIKTFKYLIEFLIIIFFFIIFKIIGIKLSSFISGKIFSIIGPLFRSKKTINQNMFIALPNKSSAEIEKYKNNMWNYYGKILAEYPFLNKFRNDESKKYIIIDGENYLEEIKSKNESVIFISGHFDNFELMALCLEKNKINLSAIYRPLNNIFLNKIMEYLRKKYICKNQIKKGRSGIRELIQLFKSGSSIALMIDQRVSEGIKSEFFGKKAYTTTIPAQFFKKFNCKIVPIHIERGDTIKFRLKVFKPIQFNQNDSIENITDELNLWLQNRIQKNPSQWIWTHNRWK
jgi:Kdo2-lipid IVA lauroyltransferase/acyltransferase